MKECNRQLHGYKIFFNDCAGDYERRLELLQNSIGLFLRRAENLCNGPYKNNPIAIDVLQVAIYDIKYVTGIRMEIDKEQKKRDR